MATYECRAPFTSTGNHVTGKLNYCTSADFTEHDCTPDGSLHGGNSSCCGHNWEAYRDLSKTAGSAVQFYGSSNIGSVKATRWDNVACSGSGDISNAVKVTMYAGSGASGAVLGAVLFIHLTDRQVNNAVVDGRSIYVGKVVNVWGDPCFSGPHVHMQEDTSGTTGSGLCCGVQVTIDDDVVYRWTV